jgi:hypothetical protein
VAKRGALCVDELGHIADAKPEYSYWDGKKYGYVAARKRIYAPLYASLVGGPHRFTPCTKQALQPPLNIVDQVENSVAFKKLAKIYRQNKRLYLWDFDGYDHVSMGRTLQQVRTHLQLTHI